MSVFQDIAEELFMQEGEFPATLLLGMEGVFGLIFGLILYFPLASILGENRSETVEQLKEAKIAGFAVGFTLLVTITGIFNIMATAVTSSMTRNVWKSKFCSCRFTCMCIKICFSCRASPGQSSRSASDSFL